MIHKLTIIILLLITACTGVEKEGGTSFIYKNQSDKSITLKVVNASLPNLNGFHTKEYYLLTNEEFQIDYISLGGGCGMLPFGGTADSLIIIFKDNKALKFDKETNSDNNPLLLNAYQTASITESYCSHTYKITNKDYNNAPPIGE